MGPSNNPFISEYADHTTLHPVGLAALILLSAAVMAARRGLVTPALLAMACFVPSAQRIVILGADFDFLRILALFGLVRTFIRGEIHRVRWNGLDSVVTMWAMAGLVIPVIRLGPDVLMNRLGECYTILVTYFAVRATVSEWRDLEKLSVALAILSFPVACFAAVEWTTARNLFAVFGGVPEVTGIREGRLRCQGAFGHPILAGCFWASALPLLVGLWWQKRRLLAACSIGAALFIIASCASATPVVGILVALCSACLYPARHSLWLMRWGVVCLLCIMHLIMNAPVWHLIARTSVLGGSSWHRFALVDGAITHFDEWWLIGSTVGSAHWGHFTFDVTNLYIVQALHGGLLLLALFIAMFGSGFRQIARALNHTEDEGTRLVIWCIGTSLAVHAFNVFGVSYFGQTAASLYITLGVVGSLRGIAESAYGGAGATKARTPWLSADHVLIASGS